MPYVCLILFAVLLLNFKSINEKKEIQQCVEKDHFVKDEEVWQNSSDIAIINKRLVDLTSNISKGITEKNKNIPYTLAHQFYIPMLYGAKTKNETLKKNFDDLMTFENVNNIVKSNDIDDLNKKVFYFFTAEYLRNYGISSPNNQKIFNLIRNETLNYWNIKSGKVWSAEKNNFKGVKERISFILTGKDNGNMSFYRAITDHELFVLAGGVSLYLSEKKTNGNRTPELANISNQFFTVLSKLTVFNNDGTWLLQPDIWKDHRDYKNSNTIIGQVSWDTSHFSRFPAFLNLLDMYTENNTSQNNFIKKLKLGLAKQFISKVALYNKSLKKYSFTNYINGNDSNYRVGYKTNPKGYSASMNNVHIFYSWWKLLNDKAVNEMYLNISDNFSIYENEKIKKLAGFYKQVIDLNYP